MLQHKKPDTFINYIVRIIFSITCLLIINTSYAGNLSASFKEGVRDCYKELEENAEILINQGVCDLTSMQIEKISSGAGISSLNLSNSQENEIRYYCNQRGALRESLAKKYKLLD